MEQVSWVLIGGALAILCIGVPAVFCIIALTLAREPRQTTPANVYHVQIDARQYHDTRTVNVQPTPAAPAPVYWPPQLDAGDRLELDAGADPAGVYVPRLRPRELPAGEVYDARVR